MSKLSESVKNSKTQKQAPLRKSYCLTMNNYKESDIQLFNRPDLFEYAIVGKEVGAQGTPHLQCYIHLLQKARFTAVKKMFPNNPHIEAAEGTAEENRRYCSKDGDFVEFGVCPLSGPQKIASDWAEVKLAAQENRLEDIEPEKYIKYYSTLKKIRSDTMSMKKLPTLDWKDGSSPNEWIYGPTGTGKSFTARKENPGFYYKMNNKWWERYNGEEVVLIEDVGLEDKWMGEKLKIWADRYPFTAEIKQDSTMLRPLKIVVTSNYHPSEIWPDKSTLEPLLRRFKLRNILTLEKFDTTKEKPKLKRTQPQMFTRVEPKYMYQDGNLVPYVNRDQFVDEMFRSVPDASHFSLAPNRDVEMKDSSSEDMNII